MKLFIKLQTKRKMRGLLLFITLAIVLYCTVGQTMAGPKTDPKAEANAQVQSVPLAAETRILKDTAVVELRKNPVPPRQVITPVKPTVVPVQTQSTEAAVALEADDENTLRRGRPATPYTVQPKGQNVVSVQVESVAENTLRRGRPATPYTEQPKTNVVSVQVESVAENTLRRGRPAKPYTEQPKVNTLIRSRPAAFAIARTLNGGRRRRPASYSPPANTLRRTRAMVSKVYQNTLRRKRPVSHNDKGAPNVLLVPVDSNTLRFRDLLPRVHGAIKFPFARTLGRRRFVRPDTLVARPVRPTEKALPYQYAIVL